MLEIKNLCAGYEERTVLKNLNLTIPEGKVTVILGPNGCGKSTFLKSLCGILNIESGQVILDGTDLLSQPPRQLAQSIAYLSQSRQIPDITAYRLVLHGRFPYLGYPRRYRKEDHAIARSVMEQMGVLELADTLMEKLSGGQRQKVYIAMALAQDTPVILLDEPTTYLDISHQMQLMQHARALAQQGKTVLMVIHDLSHAFQTADNLILMCDGEVVAEGTTERIYASGWIEKVFHVRLGRTETPGGWRYYCEEGDS